MSLAPVPEGPQLGAQHMFRWCLDTEDRYLGDNPDPEVPHTMLFLADEAPLRDDKLSTAEMNTVIWISCGYYACHEYKEHRIIPVSPPTCIWNNDRKL